MPILTPGEFKLDPNAVINNVTGQTANTLGVGINQPGTLNANIYNPPPAPPKPVAVVTSQKAENDIANKQAQYNQLINDVQGQKQYSATSSTTTPTPVPPKPTVDTSPDAIQQNLNKLMAELTGGSTGTSNVSIDNKIAAANSGFNPNFQTTDKLTKNQVSYIAGNDFTGWQQNADGTFSPDQSVIDSFRDKPIADTSSDPEQMRLNAETISNQQKLDQAFQTYNQQQNQILAGTFPLTQAQQAQMDSMRAQFQQVIDAQKTANQSFTGSLTSTYASLGIEQSAPTQALGGIMTSISVGNAKIADINAKMTDSLAQMARGFAEDNWKMVNAAWKNTADYVKQRQDTIDKMQEAHTKAVEKAQAYEKDIRDKRKKAQDALIQSTRDSAIADLMSQGISNPVEMLNYLNFNEAGQQVGDFTAKEVADAMKNLQVDEGTLPPNVKEYQFYAKQTQQAGGVPINYDEWRTRDENRKAKAAAIAGGRLDSPTLTKVQGIANQFDGEQTVKDFNTAATNISFIKTLGVTPTDDIARVYAFAKVMDPNSVVREGEYKSVQDYSQALFNAYGLKAKRVFDNVGFLTPEARTFLEKTLNQRLSTQEKTYKNVYNEYARRINKITGSSDGSEYLTDYSKGYLSIAGEVAQTEEDASNKLQTYKLTHPEKEAELKSAADGLEQTLGRPITASEFLEAFPEYK